MILLFKTPFRIGMLGILSRILINHTQCISQVKVCGIHSSITEFSLSPHTKDESCQSMILALLKGRKKRERENHSTQSIKLMGLAESTRDTANLWNLDARNTFPDCESHEFCSEFLYLCLSYDLQYGTEIGPLDGLWYDSF